MNRAYAYASWQFPVGERLRTSVEHAVRRPPTQHQLHADQAREIDDQFLSIGQCPNPQAQRGFRRDDSAKIRHAVVEGSIGQLERRRNQFRPSRTLRRRCRQPLQGGHAIAAHQRARQQHDLTLIRDRRQRLRRGRRTSAQRCKGDYERESFPRHLATEQNSTVRITTVRSPSCLITLRGSASIYTVHRCGVDAAIETRETVFPDGNRDVRAIDQTLTQAGAPKPLHHEMRDAMLRRVNDWRRVLLERHVAGCRDVLQRMVGRFDLINPASLPDYVRALMPDPECFSVKPAFYGFIGPHACDFDTYVWRPRGDLRKVET